MTEVKTAPFLGWTNDKDILNQQREYWGAMNGIKALQEENRKMKEALTKIQDLPIFGEGYLPAKEILDTINATLNEEKK